MQVIVNSHTYELWPKEQYTKNPDYLVQEVAPNQSNFVSGFLMWEGNGTTTFNYKCLDVYGETLGDFPDYTSALTALDNLIWRGRT